MPKEEMLAVMDDDGYIEGVVTLLPAFL